MKGNQILIECLNVYYFCLFHTYHADDDFGSSGSNLYETNRNRNDTGSSLDSSNEAFTGNQGNHTPNVITVAQQLLGSVANFVSSSSESLVNSLTTTVPGSTAQNNWSFSSAPMTSVQNTAMAVQSPQLHAALTMSSLPSPNVSLHDAYTSLIHQQGITNSDQQHNQQTNFIPFSTTAIPIGIHTSNLTMNGQQNQIEVGNVRGEANQIQNDHTLGIKDNPRSHIMMKVNA